MTCPACGSTLWDGQKCSACGRLGTDLTPRAGSRPDNVSVPLGGVALLAGVLFLAVGFAGICGWGGGDSSSIVLGTALFVAGYLACFVVSALHRRLNDVEAQTGRQLDAHERRLAALEKGKD